MDLLELLWEMLKPLLKFLLSIVIVLAVPAGIILLIVLLEPWFSTLPKETQEGIGVGVAAIMLVGVNILSYCASYVWEKRNPLFFWGGLLVSIIGVAVYSGLII